MTNTIGGIPLAKTPAEFSSIPETPTDESQGFGSVLKQALEQVDQLHADAQQQSVELISGSRADMHNVMISIEKADVAFQLMMQVRNKIVNAYQEISRMQF